MSTDTKILEKIHKAGVAGAGGAGFPAAVKLDCRAEYVIANGAECEPLLQVDKQLMEIKAKEIIEGLVMAMDAVGANEGVLFLKEHYHKAADALRKEIGRKKNIRLFLSKSYYPVGDEQQIIYEVTRRTVPPGGLLKDIGCVVCNVSTLRDIARAAAGIPVTERYITVAGAVKNPKTLLMPIGAPMEILPELSGGQIGTGSTGNMYIIGGPCMGELTDTLSDKVVTKTTGGLLVIPKNHPLCLKKSADIRLKSMLSVCCQCSMCTYMCPRHALGLGTSPHLAMRSILSGKDLFRKVNAILTCCDCGICTYQACNFGLNPALIMSKMKQEMLQNGIKPKREEANPADPHIDYKRLATSRLIARLGIQKYDVPAPMDNEIAMVSNVKIPLKMHIGAKSIPIVKKGERVERGTPIAKPPQNALGVFIHASIGGVVTEITGEYIEINA